MPAHRLEITINEDTLARLDSARGHEPRASFVKRALDAFLDDVPIRDPATIAALKASWDSPALTKQFTEVTEPVTEVLGAKVRKVPKSPSLKDTWGR